MAMVGRSSGRLQKWAIAALQGLAWLAAEPTAAGALPCQLEFEAPRSVAKVIDGETLALDGGSEVRLIGALAPRGLDGAASDAAWPLEAQATAALEKLVVGKTVELGMAGRRTDRYGRLLAQVFVREGETRIWLQGEMLRNGHARAYGLPGSTECFQELVAAERLAREGGIGLWSHAAYQVRPADRTWALRRFRSTYQIVEGRITRAKDVRGHVYLNVGRSSRNALTLMVRPAHRAAFDESKIDFMALRQRTVRVRGWIEGRAGLTMELYDPAQIEVLAD